MKTLIMLEDICNDFIERKFNLEELQSWLNTLIAEDSLKNNLGKVLIGADNRWEKIRFSSLESNFYPCGVEVAKNLLEKIKYFN